MAPLQLSKIIGALIKDEATDRDIEHLAQLCLDLAVTYLKALDHSKYRLFNPDEKKD
jgi:hypothetical protein